MLAGLIDDGFRLVGRVLPGDEERDEQAGGEQTAPDPKDRRHHRGRRYCDGPDGYHGEQDA
jgi:hypothetical protein